MFWQIVTMGVAVPAAEEVAFRGLGFVKLRENCPFWQAALLSSALFGVYHGNVLQGIYGFIMGMIFAWAMERKNTIAAPFFMHMAAVRNAKRRMAAYDAGTMKPSEFNPGTMVYELVEKLNA